MRKFNNSNTIYRKKVLCGGKTVYVERKFSGGSLVPITRVKRLGKTQIRLRTKGCHRGLSVPQLSTGGRAQSKRSSSSISNSILKSLSKTKKGGTISRYV